MDIGDTLEVKTKVVMVYRSQLAGRSELEVEEFVKRWPPTPALTRTAVTPKPFANSPSGLSGSNETPFGALAIPKFGKRLRQRVCKQ